MAKILSLQKLNLNRETANRFGSCTSLFSEETFNSGCSIAC
jgi:hypothetical protein